MILSTAKGFVGIDERKRLSEGFTHATSMLNLRVTDSGSLEKRGNIESFAVFDSDIDGIWHGEIAKQEFIAIAEGNRLWRVDVSDGKRALIGEIGTGVCLMFKFNGLLYIKTDTTYQKYDGLNLQTVSGYVPTVAISCSADGSGEIFEQINLISDKRRQLFSGDGVSTKYSLAEKAISGISYVLLDGILYAGRYTVENENGAVVFESPIPKGLNNLEIVYRKDISESDRARIMGCRRAMLFGGNSDGRVFLYGNDDYPNYRFHSELASGIPSAEYFPINAFTVIGNSRINCIVQQYDRQLIFTRDTAYYSYCELKSDSLGNTVSSFPVFSLNSEKGCLIETDGCVINNTPVTLCIDGLNVWESTSVVNEKNARCISMPICDTVAILTPAETENAYLVDNQKTNELYFIVNGINHIYNYGNGSFYRFDGFGGSRYTVGNGILYFANGCELYRFGQSDNKSCDCFWQSPFINRASVGRSDCVMLSADIYVGGVSKLSISLQKDGGDEIIREFVFGANDIGYKRINFRPSLKRAMPYRITVRMTGGEIALHGLSIKTKDRKRSERNGIL